MLQISPPISSNFLYFGFLRSLQQTLVELGNFQQRLDFWQRQQDRLVQEQASIENRLASQIDYAEWTIQQKINHQIYNDGASPKHSGSASDKNKGN